MKRGVLHLVAAVLLSLGTSQAMAAHQAVLLGSPLAGNIPMGIITPTPTPAPTATPTPTPTPVPDPSDLIIGYFPNNDSGRASVFFTDHNVYPARTSHRIRVFNGGGVVTIYDEIIAVPYTEPETQNRDFDLPRDPAEIPPLDPRSYETGLVLRVIARVGNAAVYTNSILYGLRHQSADLTDIGFTGTVVRTDPPGNYPASFTDSRPTGPSGNYRYDVIRRSFYPAQATTQVNSLVHGSSDGGVNATSDHLPKTQFLNLPVVVGDQIFWVRPRETYKNSAGANIGRFDVAPKSPNLDVSLDIP